MSSMVGARIVRKRVIANLDQRSLIVQCLAWQAIGLLLLACHIILVKQSVVLYPVVIVMVGVLYSRSSLAGLMVAFQMLLYQNIMLALLSSEMEVYYAFATLQATNFVVLTMMAYIAAIRLLPNRAEYPALSMCIIVALAGLVLYTGYGAIRSGPMSAITYFREFAGVILAALIGLNVGRVWGYQTIATALFYASLIAVVTDVVEWLWPIEFYELTNAVRFMQLKWRSTAVFYAPLDIIKFTTHPFLNITGTTVGDPMSFDGFRVIGSIMNPISNAYVLAVLVIVAVSLKRSLWLVLLLPMLVLAGAKGPLILVFSSLGLYSVWAFSRSRKLLITAYVCFAVLYVGAGLVIGLRSMDYHAIGLMGGVRSLVSTPWGHGIGVGGNLSARANAGFKWNGSGGFQTTGADFALESAVGVLFYQMGLASAAVLSVFGALLWEAPLGVTRRFNLPKRTDIVLLAAGTVALNGVFQEEAYAPYAAGLVVLLAAVLIGNQRFVGNVMRTRTRQHYAEFGGAPA